MGYQVFPQPSGAADYENLGIEVTSTSTAIPTNITGVLADFAVTTAVTVGIYSAIANTSNTAIFVFGTSANTVQVNPNTSVPTLITVNTNLTSFTVRVPQGWNQESGSVPFSASSSKINYLFMPEDTRPIIAAGGQPTANANQLVHSTNGVSFTGRIFVNNSGGSNPGRVAWHDGSNFYAISEGGNDNIWWSTNGGVNWTTRTDTSFTANKNGLYAAYYDTTLARHWISSDNFADGRVMFTSTNGTSWTSQGSQFGDSAICANRIGRVGSYVYAIGHTGGDNRTRLMLTTNGTNWNTVFSTSCGSATGVAFNGSTTAPVYTLVTEQGFIFASTNITSWSSQSGLGQATQWRPGFASVAYGDNYFVAAGGWTNQSNSIMYSQDGFGWTDVSGTSGVTTSAQTYQWFMGGYWGTGRQNKWNWYRFTGVSTGNDNLSGGRIHPQGQSAFTHDSPVGRNKVSWRAVLSRFKLNRNL